MERGGYPDGCSQSDLDRSQGIGTHLRDEDDYEPREYSDNISTEPCICGSPWDQPCKPGCAARSQPCPFDEERNEKLNAALAAIERRHGKRVA